MADGHSLEQSADTAPGTSLPPLPTIQIRWAGALAVVAFVALIGVVARLLGPEVAAAATLIGLGGLALSSIRARHRRIKAMTVDGTTAVEVAVGDAVMGFDCADFGGGGDC